MWWLDSHKIKHSRVECGGWIATRNKHSRVECGGWIATRNKHSRVECGGWIATKSSTVGCWLDSHKSQNYISLAPRRLRSPVEP